jgi:hypothetical protein
VNEWGDRLRDGKRGEQIQELVLQSSLRVTTLSRIVTPQAMTRTSEERMPRSSFKATSSGPRFDIGIPGHILCYLAFLTSAHRPMRVQKTRWITTACVTVRLIVLLLAFFTHDRALLEVQIMCQTQIGCPVAAVGPSEWPRLETTQEKRTY